ncbi:MAG TPA: hypothetical protein GYA08_14295 [Chloroflexi bacterium]|nr:hypothetical protein [Chloroflexota bacterium]
MFEQQPQHVRRFLWLIGGGALLLALALLSVAGRPPEWTPAINPLDDTLIPVDDPSPPHFTPGTLTRRPADAIQPAPLPAPYTLRWRAGVGIPDGDPSYFDWPVDRPGWYLTWSTNHRTESLFWGLTSRTVMDLPPAFLGMEFTPMVRMKNGRLYPDTQTLHELARNHRGLTWLIGNEPDVRWQDNTPPEVYAVAYHRAYTAIKSADPTAQIAIGGVSQVTPLRLAYLDRVWDFYQSLYGAPMPVDVWNMHAFVLREERGGWGVNIPPGFYIDHRGELWEIDEHDNLTLVETQVRDMRQWMAAHGQQEKPLWITEYGILMPATYGFDAARVIAFMEGSFDLFQSLRDPTTGLAEDDYRLVQRWNWYSARDSRYPTGNLFDNYGRSTPVGDAYWAYLQKGDP